MVSITYTLEQALQYIKEDAKDDARRLKQRRAEQIKRVKKNSKIIAQLAVTLPEGCRLEVDSQYRYMSIRVNVERAALPALRKAVGRLHINSKNLYSAEEKTVMVSLNSERFPDVNFVYIRPLGENATCQIVEETNTYKTLVCKL